MARVRLIFKSVCRISDSDDRGLLLLVDSVMNKQLAVPCGHYVLQEFIRRIEGGEQTTKMLPEAMLSVLKQQGDMNFEVLIDGLLPSGDYSALLIHSHTLTSHPIDLSEAVLLSFASRGEIPIYIEDKFFNRQSTPYDTETHSVSIPLDVMDSKVIEESLQKAIKEENYELASILRDELNRRQRESENQSSQQNKKDKDAQ